MMMWSLCVALLLVAPTLGYDTGAPESSCSTMRPGHTVVKSDPVSALISPQTMGGSYYRIFSDTNVFGPRDTVNVTIIAEDAYYIEGFLIRAFDSNDKPIGMWIPTNNKTQKAVCPLNSGGTHINLRSDNNGSHAKWKTVTMLWRAPTTWVKNVHFRATVVKGYSTFYMNIKSNILNKVEPNGAARVLEPAILMVTIATTLLAVFH